MASLKDRISRRVFGKPAVGVPAARMAKGAGMVGCSKYISRWCNWAPEVVEFELGWGNDVVKGKMYSAEGTDHVARQIWMAGAGSYEPPLPGLFLALTRESVWARKQRRMPSGARGEQGEDGITGAPQGMAPQGDVLIVGANSGLYAMLAALGNGAERVHAFEPYPPAIKWLEANIKLNGLGEKIKVVKAAIGNSVGETDLFVPPPRFGTTLETSASINPGFHEEVGQRVRVPVLTVDEYVRREKLEGVGVMLIDVEGFEHSALEGSAEVMQKNRPVVAFEVLTRSTTRVDLLEGVRKRHGYRCLVMRDDELKVSEPVQPCGEHTNQLMVPQEGMEKVREAAGRAGLRMGS